MEDLSCVQFKLNSQFDQRSTCVNLQYVSMPPKQESKDQIRSKINVETQASITDFQYNHNGNKLAVADSDGYLFLFERQAEGFIKIASFRGDEAAIWKLAWADPAYGDTIAIGTFKRKVAIFQLRNSQWTEIAYHQLHQGSVNYVQWAPAAFGCKLFSAGSEGTVAILQLKKNAWASSSFLAHQCTISGFSVRSVALNQSENERNDYPMIATAAKDNTIKIWRHVSQIPQNELLKESKIYQQVLVLKPHKQTIRALLWKKRWSESTPAESQIFTCSEDGTVKLHSFVGDKLKQTTNICQYELPVFRISQTLTGNVITVSVGESEQSYLYGQRQSQSEWELLQELK